MSEYLMIWEIMWKELADAFDLTTMIAYGAMIATFWQARISINHNKMSVRPYIAFHYYTYPITDIILGIENYGLGPGIIKSLSCAIDGEEHPFESETFQEKLRNHCKGKNLKYSYMSMSKDTPIAVGQKVNLISISNPDESPEINEDVLALIDKLDFILKYESIYEEKFKETFREEKNILTRIKMTLRSALGLKHIKR